MTAGGSDAAPVHFFVGRERELAAIARELEEAVGGRGRIVLLEGEAGIGKTRLAEQFVELARRTGAEVLWGSCEESVGAPPFWPWTQMLRSYLASRDAEAVRSEVGGGAAAIAEVLPELGDFLPDLDPLPSLPPDESRFRLFDSIGSLFVSAAKSHPVVLVLDDLHWADPASLLLLEFLGRHIRTYRVLVLGTHRDLDPRQFSMLPATLGELVRQPGTRRFMLGGLSRDEITTYIASTTQAPVATALVDAVIERTEGNPLFVGEVLRLLLSEGRTNESSERERDFIVPPGAREAILRRLEHLSAPCRRLLTLAAVVGRQCPTAVLEALNRLEPEGDSLPLDELIEEASADRMLIETPGSERLLTISHTLIRETLLVDFAPAWRTALHLRIAAALQEVYRDQLDDHLSEIAHHYVEAARRGQEPDSAIRFARRAGEHALRRHAYEHAALQLERALEVTPRHGTFELQRCELLIELGSYRLKTADLDGARRELTEAAEIARALQQPDLLARAALAYAPWTSYGRAKDSGIEMLEEALAAVDVADSPLRAELLARLAHYLEIAGAGAERSRRIVLSRDAIEMARRLGEQRTLARALHVARWIDWDLTSVGERTRMTAEIQVLAKHLRDPEIAVIGEGWHLVDCVEAGEPVECHAALRRHTALAEELRQPEYLWWNAVWRTMTAVMEGRFTDGERLVAETLAIGQGVERENAQLLSQAQLAEMLIYRGYLEQTLIGLEAVFAERREVLEGDTSVICRRAQLFAELGRVVEARREFERLAVDGFAALPIDVLYSLNLSLLAVTCAVLGDERRAALLYERLQPAAGRNLLFGPAFYSPGPCARYQGLLAATMRRPELAQRHFEEALQMSRRMGWVPLVARTQCDYAAALLERGRRRDQAAARRLLEEARETADQLEMTLVAQRACRMLEQCAAVGSAPATAPLPETGNVWLREGEYWTITYEGTSRRVRNSTGLRYLGELLRIPGREVHTLELVALVGQESLPADVGAAAEVGAWRGDDANEVLDAKARAAYRGRLAEIDGELAEAERHHDLGRIQRLRAERDAVEAQILGAVGAGGRPRRAASPAERARVNVSRAIKTAIARVDAVHPALGRHLLRRIRTGTYCAYLPDPRIPVSWTVSS